MTGDMPTLLGAFMLLVLLVRRLEDGVWEWAVGAGVVGESIIIMTACLRLAPAERGSTWVGMLENVKGPGVSVETGSIVVIIGGVGDPFLRFPSKKPVKWDGGREGREVEGEGKGLSWEMGGGPTGR